MIFHKERQKGLKEKKRTKSDGKFQIRENIRFSIFVPLRISAGQNAISNGHFGRRPAPNENPA